MTKPGALSLVLALSVTAWGCSRAENAVQKEQAAAGERALRSEQGPARQARRPKEVSPPLAEQLRKVHAEADAARSKKEKARSSQRLLSLFDATEGESSPHLTSVRQDLAARAAELLLDESPEQAKQSAERGLFLSNTPTVLRANLLLVLADAEEALGNQDKAKRALVEALLINEELFKSEIETP